MAKMFYTLDEVCQKLDKSEDEVKEMVSSGQIQEFRDRDKLMFKVDQIDLLTGDEDTGDVHLDLEATGSGDSGADLTGGGIDLTSSAIGLTGSGLDLKEESVLGLADSMGATSEETGDGSIADTGDFDENGATEGTGTGISVFDTAHGTGEYGSGDFGVGSEDFGGETQIGEAVADEELSLESVGSGSGLLDLTRESDETSLGAELLEEVYSSNENLDLPANASGLFEAAAPEGSRDEMVTGAPAMSSSVAGMPVIVEAYDGSGSGLGTGMLLGALAALVIVAIIIIVTVSGATSGLAMMIAGSLWIWVGGLAAATVILGVVGMFIGRASE